MGTRLLPSSDGSDNIFPKTLERIMVNQALSGLPDHQVTPVTGLFNSAHLFASALILCPFKTKFKI
jgi:hypothetical protein